MKQGLSIILIWVMSFSNVVVGQDKRLDGFDTYVADVLKKMDAAGCTITVIEKGKVVLAKGYGYKDLENKIPVTANTLFAIGSCTKAFTTTIIGQLADEKRLQFDKPVNEIMPELRFKDPNLTANVTVRDMICHRTGLPRHDLVWFGRTKEVNRDTFLHIIRYLDATTALRERFQYNNFMYMAQGALAQKITGKTWEQLVRERIFTPLGMNNTTLNSEEFLKSSDRSLGYWAVKGKIKKKDYYTFNGLEPAGSICSSANEMAKWLRLWIYGGKYEDKQVFSSNYFNEAISPQMLTGENILSAKDTAQSYAYGFAWFLGNHKGHFRAEHGGNIDGFSSTIAFYPNDSLGIFVSVNQDLSAVPMILRNSIADRMLNEKPTDWLKPRYEAKIKADTTKLTNNDSLNQKLNTKPSHQLADYVGKYREAAYGTVEIVLKNDTLHFLYGNENIALTHFHYDIFKSDVSEEQLEFGVKVHFQTDWNGDISAIKVGVSDEMAKVIFYKVLPTIKLTTNDLQKYAATFEVEGEIIKTYVDKGALRLFVSGQPEYELVPTKLNEFRMVNAEGFSFRFEMEKDKPSVLYLIQPNGTFKATVKKK